MRSFLAGAAAAVLLTGCDTATAQSGTGDPGGGSRTTLVVNGSRAEAQAYVRHLMAELSLPEGSEPTHWKSLPEIVRVQAPDGPGASYTLRFTPREKHGPVVTVSAFCQTVAITVNGRPQPSLWDTNGGLGTIADNLLGR